MPEPRPIDMKHNLQETHGALAYIIQALRETRHIDQLFKQYAPDEIAQHCEVILLHQNHLLLQVKSNAWAAKFRFYQSDLLSTLRKTPEFKGLAKIDLCIEKPIDTHQKAPDPNQKPPPIPQSAIDTAMQWAQETDDQALKQALEHFAAHRLNDK